MLEIEKKRAEEIDSKMTVDINLETGQVTMKTNLKDNAFTTAQQNRDTNDFMMNQI